MIGWVMQPVWSCRSAFLVFSLVSCMALLAPPALSLGAGPQNGGFEAGDLSAWSSFGDVWAADAGYEGDNNMAEWTDPPEGDFCAMLYGRWAGAGSPDVDTFLGLAGVATWSDEPAPGYFAASALKQTITANAGDVVSFQWWYGTSELGTTPSYPDPAYFVVGTTAVKLAWPNSPLVQGTSPFFNDVTGWRSYEYVIRAAGTYDIGFVVGEIRDRNAGSGLVVDAVQVAPGTLPRLGDANRDGAVSDADYTLWADHYGFRPATWAMGDFSSSGAVTDADYTIWADQYGSAAGAVPEPAALAVLALGTLPMPHTGKHLRCLRALPRRV